MLKNIWIPDQSFNFPITATNHRNLRLQHRWFIRFKWLAYSYLENGAFCKYCVLFGSKGSGVGNQPLGTLCTVKFQKWKNALERFADRESTKYHREKRSLLPPHSRGDILCSRGLQSVQAHFSTFETLPCTKFLEVGFQLHCLYFQIKRSICKRLHFLNTISFTF